MTDTRLLAWTFLIGGASAVALLFVLRGLAAAHIVPQDVVL